MDKIYTGNDKAHEIGYDSLRSMIYDLARQRGFKLTGKISRDKVKARIDFGRWIADCPCGGAGYVDPDDPIFWCGSCGNEKHHGDFLTVVFPKNREEIENEILARPVRLLPEKMLSGPTQGAMNSIPVLPGLPRSWNPGESVEELKRQKFHAISHDDNGDES